MPHRRTYTGQRFERTLDAAFRTPRYAAAIERPLPTFWQRLLQSIREILS